MRCAAIIAALAACRAPCPKPSLPVQPPAVIEVTPDKTPCVLPELPEPIKVVGFPAPDGQSIYVSKSDLAGLAGYLVSIRAYVEAAGLCLRVSR